LRRIARALCFIPPRLRWGATALLFSLLAVGLLWGLRPTGAMGGETLALEPGTPPLPSPGAPVQRPEPIRQEIAIPVLMYHAISPGPNNLYVPPEELDEQLGHLAQLGYHTITLEQMYDHFTRGERLPEKPIVLTFDDGYADFYTNALPILQKHRMVATLFVITDLVGQPNYITWEQAKEIARAGIEIGSHTLTHPDLTTLDAKRLERELTESRKVLEERLGVRVPFFAYPAGRFNEKVLALVRQTYAGAVTTVGGVATPCQDVAQWRRIRVNQKVSPEALIETMRYWERETKPEECKPAPFTRPKPAGGQGLQP
jgi:peptidoglycan/xylan/chitin deacetylase (PgdA/CDA1 family)